MNCGDTLLRGLEINCSVRQAKIPEFGLGVFDISISIIDISTLFENINIDITIFENIVIDKAILENIDIGIDIDKDIFYIVDFIFS